MLSSLVAGEIALCGGSPVPFGLVSVVGGLAVCIMNWSEGGANLAAKNAPCNLWIV